MNSLRRMQSQEQLSPLIWALAFFIGGAFPSEWVKGGDNWPEFRGPKGDGQSDSKDLPIHWSETQNIKWKVPIHDKGWSSPVIWGNQIWLTTATADGKKLFVLCVNRDTGNILHNIKLFDVEKPGYCIPTNSYASPTPVVEPGRVYVHFGTYGTACLDTVTGKTQWERRDLPCDHFRAPGSSPILYGDSLFVNFDGFDVQYVVALDNATGETRWKSTRDIDYGTTNGDFKKAFGTPTVIQVNGQAQLISPSAVATIAYDPSNGHELWKVYHGGMNAAARPLFGDGRVFLTTGDAGAPIAGGWHRMLAIRPDGHDDVTKSHVLWTRDKAVPARSSFLLVGDLLFMVSDNGVASCLEAASGKEVWQRRLGGTFYASPIYAEGHIYFFDDGGVSHVMEASREAKVLAQNHLDAGCMASTAVAGKALFVRTKTHLYRIERSDKGQANLHGAAKEKVDDDKEPEVKGRKFSDWVKQLKNGDQSERWYAVMALGEMGPKAIPALTEALKDKESSTVRVWAAAGLRRNGKAAKNAVPQLEETLKDEIPFVRIEAAKALWAICEHEAAVPTLIELVKDKEPGYRWDAAEALGWIGPKAKAAVPALTNMLKDLGRAREDKPDGTVLLRTVNIAARKALEKIDPEAAKKAGID